MLMSSKVEKALNRYLSYPKRPDKPHAFLNQTGEPLPYRGLVGILLRLERHTGVHCNPHKWRHSAQAERRCYLP